MRIREYLTKKQYELRSVTWALVADMEKACTATFEVLGLFALNRLPLCTTTTIPLLKKDRKERWISERRLQFLLLSNLFMLERCQARARLSILFCRQEQWVFPEDEDLLYRQGQCSEQEAKQLVRSASLLWYKTMTHPSCPVVPDALLLGYHGGPKARDVLCTLNCYLQPTDSKPARGEVLIRSFGVRGLLIENGGVHLSPGFRVSTSDAETLYDAVPIPERKSLRFPPSLSESEVYERLLHNRQIALARPSR